MNKRGGMYWVVGSGYFLFLFLIALTIIFILLFASAQRFGSVQYAYPEELEYDILTANLLNTCIGNGVVVFAAQVNSGRLQECFEGLAYDFTVEVSSLDDAFNPRRASYDKLGVDIVTTRYVTVEDDGGARYPGIVQVKV